jgi:hypothetical protein
MAILVLRCQKLLVGHSMHHRDPRWLVELYLETPADRDLKMSCVDASLRQLQSAREIRV